MYLGVDLRIPTLLISYEDGYKIKSFIDSNKEETVTLFTKFEWVFICVVLLFIYKPQSDTALIEIWISTHD